MRNQEAKPLFAVQYRALSNVTQKIVDAANRVYDTSIQTGRCDDLGVTSVKRVQADVARLRKAVSQFQELNIKLTDAIDALEDEHEKLTGTKGLQLEDRTSRDERTVSGQ